MPAACGNHKGNSGLHLKPNLLLKLLAYAVGRETTLFGPITLQNDAAMRSSADNSKWASHGTRGYPPRKRLFGKTEKYPEISHRSYRKPRFQLEEGECERVLSV